MLYDRVRLKQNTKAAMLQARPKTWVVSFLFLIILGAVGGTVGALVPNPLGGFVGSVVEAMMENRSLDTLLPGDYEEMALEAMGIVGVTTVLSTGASVIVGLLRALMSYGYYGYGLEVYRRETRAGIGSLFRGFPRFGAVVGSAVLVGVFSLLWGLLIYGLDAAVTVLLLVLSDGERWLTWLGVAVLFLAAVLVHSLVTYRYCLIPYLVLDDRQKTPVTQLITMGVQAMKGNIFKRFVLDLSFLGWELLRGVIAAVAAVLSSMVVILVAGGSIGILVDFTERGDVMMTYDARFVAAMLILAVSILAIFGIAALAQLPLKLWLMSYKNVARAGFYQELMGSKLEPVPAVAVPITGSEYFVNTQPTAPVTPFASPAEEAPPRGELSPEGTEGGDTPVSPALPITSPYTPFGGGGAAPAHVPFESPAAPETSETDDVSPAPETVAPVEAAQEPPTPEEPEASEPFLPAEEESDKTES